MIVQWKICKDLGNKRRRVHIYELKEALSPECGTFESGDKVEDGDHENTFDRAVEVCQKQDASMVFFPSRKIEVT
jgi:hypothetical protein